MWVQKQGASVLHTTNRQDKHKTRSFQELINASCALSAWHNDRRPPQSVPKPRTPCWVYKNRQVLLPLRRADRIQQGMATPFCRVDRIRQTYAGRSTSRPRYTSRDIDTASYLTTYIAHTVRLSAPFASSRNADSLSTEPHINIHDDLVHHRS